MRPALRRTPAQWAVNGALLGLVAITLFPLVWMLAVSFMTPGEASTYPPPLVPRDPTLANYRELFAHAGMARYVLNSVLLALAVTALSLAFNVAAGYAFAKLRFKGRERIFRLMLGALVIPSQVALVPLFLLLKQLGLVNTYGGVIVPAMASIFGIFLVRQYALAIPDDLLDAARIDGASELRILRSIAVPLVRPAVLTAMLVTFIGPWNEFLWPFLVTKDASMQPLAVSLANFSQANSSFQANPMGAVLAGACVLAVPAVVLFLLFQRHFTSANLGSAVKG
jgi:multiple sugar transport system permease protein